MIAGKARGRKLRSVPGDATRPITDRTKSALFNIIGGDIVGATFLDLFAGTGSVGIEALSRGASFTRFLDILHVAVNTIKANLVDVGLSDDSEVLNQDALQYLDKKPDRTFDYIYIAPPQYKGIWERVMHKLEKNHPWLSEDGWVIVQIHPIEYLSLALDCLVEFDRRQYGSTMLVFYRRP